MVTYQLSPPEQNTAAISAANRSPSIIGGRKSTKTLLGADYIPDEKCVLCGRGKMCSTSTGNRRLNSFVEYYRKLYSGAQTKIEKSNIVSSIVASIKSFGGAFVKYEEDIWWEVNDTFAREKVGCLFRDSLYTQYRSSTKAKIARRQRKGGPQCTSMLTILPCSSPSSDLSSSHCIPNNTPSTIVSDTCNKSSVLISRCVVVSPVTMVLSSCPSALVTSNKMLYSSSSGSDYNFTMSKKKEDAVSNIPVIVSQHANESSLSCLCSLKTSQGTSTTTFRAVSIDSPCEEEEANCDISSGALLDVLLDFPCGILAKSEPVCDFLEEIF